MKQTTSFIIVACCFLFNLSSTAQDENIILQPENSKEYIYEFSESKYFQSANSNHFTDYIKKKSLKIKCENIEPGNREYLLVSVIENRAEKPESFPTHFKDYRFPEFKDGFYENRYDSYWEELLPWIKYFQYQFDRETMELKLHNREAVLSEITNLLQKKGFDKKGIERHTSDFNTKGIAQLTRQLQQVFQIQKNTFQNETNEPSKFFETIDSTNSVISVRQKKSNKTVGIYSRYYSYDPKEKFLKEFKIIELDSAKYSFRALGDPLNLFYIENKISLKSKKDIQEKRLFLSGKIENPKYKKVSLVILRDPFGTNLYKKTVQPDENGSFHLESEFKHNGLVYVQFEQAYHDNQLPGVVLYAEPGNHIYFDAKGVSSPQEIDFAGDNNQVSEMIYDFKKEYDLSFQKGNSNSFPWFLNRGKYDELERALRGCDSFFKKYKNRMPEYIYNYVTTELKAYLYSGVLFYLNYLQRDKNIRYYGQIYFPERDKVDYQYLESLIENFQLHRNYNDYGFYSRQLAGDLLDYQYNKTKSIYNLRNLDRSNFVIRSYMQTLGDLPNKVEFAKNVLAGHALYSQLAGILLREKMNTLNYLSKDERYIQNEVTNYFDLMMRLVNNREFVNNIEILMENHLKWQKKDYIPDTKFLNPRGEEVYLSDFFGTKPAVFYITQWWDKERYFWDDLARENPEINFVLVMEGSNFHYWKDYTKRAEPFAHQLFLVNDNQHLRDIFKKDDYHFIACDKNGLRIGFAEDPINCMNLAKHSLMVPAEKEPERSKLIIIIAALGILLIVGFLAFILWRWRTRQRFRKEQLHRRLRELELTAIRSQMNPHFLFNCLNSVQNLVQQNRGHEAHLYLADFAGIIRKVLQNSEKEEVSLNEELEMVRQYLNLEKLRFDFDFNISVDESIDTNNTMIPSMLLQPFAENAVVHGLQNKDGDRNLVIKVFRTNNYSISEFVKAPAGAKGAINKSDHNSIIIDQQEGIVIVIEDNGIGRTASQKISAAKNGKGSKMMKERLELLQQKQGEKYRLQIIDLDEKGKTGTRIEILIPEEN